MKKYIYPFVLLLLLSIFASNAYAEKEPFGAWLAGLYEEAWKSGIRQETLDKALGDIQPIERVIELDRKQPESQISFATYRERIVNQTRIRKGRALLAEHADILREVEARYGVAPQYVVALWGIETNYGSNTGGFDVIASLATLAWEGRRASFFRKELLLALKILDEGHISHESMKGSWAGAMGQNQFMPSSFHNFAVDHDSDGRRDIWGTQEDVFASTANYLKRNGWKEGQRWGRRVRIPDGFSKDLVDLKTRKSLMEWLKLGVRQPDGSPIPVVAGMKGELVAPDGIGGPVYLVYDNYRTIMSWNRSTYFATSVGLLADQIAQ